MALVFVGQTEHLPCEKTIQMLVSCESLYVFYGKSVVCACTVWNSSGYSRVLQLVCFDIFTVNLATVIFESLCS
jgi:xanthine/uracil permease